MLTSYIFTIVCSLLIIIYITYVRIQLLNHIDEQIRKSIETQTQSIIENINSQTTTTYEQQKKNFEDFLANIF